ncbi:MAG: cyanophycin synthetase [Limnospira sp.]
MKILKTQTLRGPNYWSIDYQNLILIYLDLEDIDDRFTDEIPDFYEGLVDALPSLKEPDDVATYREDFLRRVKKGTLIGTVVEHVALELQNLIGMPVCFGRTRAATQKGVYRVLFEYQIPEAGRYAARAAVRLCHGLIDRGYYPPSELAKDLDDLREIWTENRLGPTTEAIIAEAQRRGIPWRELPSRYVIQLGYGKNQRRIQASQTDGTSILGIEYAGDKEGTKALLREANIPVPRGEVIYRARELDEAVNAVGGFPVVIKPLDGNHGRGITLDIQSWRDAEEAYDRAKAESKFGGVIVERFHEGNDYRVLVIDGKVVAVAQRIPAHVVGDGRSTIQELVEETNRDPRRGSGHENVLTRIDIDGRAEEILAAQNLRLDSVPDEGEICHLRATANLSTGGIAIDRTDEIHPENRWLAERAAKLVGLDVAGIDITATDIGKPLRDIDGAIVEVNAAPGLRMHLQPSQGQPRDVTGPILDLLYPHGSQSSRVPIVAITGTNGKTTTTRLTAHIFRQTQQTIGYTTTDGTYIGDFLAEAGDNTGPQSAQLILGDPTVDVAVLECARGGILRSGLGFNCCDVGVVLNVSDDHLGLHDINTVEDMAYVKSVVAESAHRDGYAVLNADDRLVADMAKRVKGKVAYFSMQPDNPIVLEHVDNGGIAAVYEEGYLSLLRGGEPSIRVEQMANVPLTLGGRAPFMIANVLAASLAAYVGGVSVAEISTALRTFKASVEQTPGRMNLIPVDSFHVLLDYAHNPASYRAIADFVNHWTGGDRIGVIGAPGDRRNEDFVHLGRLSAAMFDRIIVKEDDDTRGRDRGEVADYIYEGIREEKPDGNCQVILDETRAIETALKEATPGCLVVILPESVKRAIALIES